MNKSCFIVVFVGLIGLGQGALRSTLTRNRIEYTFWTGDVDHVSFHDAVSACSYRGKHRLVAITDDTAKLTVWQLVEPWKTRDVWIGLSDNFVEQTWSWFDGTRVDAVPQYWGAEPTYDETQNCGFSPDGNLWYERVCDEPHGYICQRENKIGDTRAQLTLSNEDPTVYESGNVQIDCSASNALSEMTWYKNGKKVHQVAGTNGVTLVIENATVEDAGFYTCSATKFVDGLEQKVMAMAKLEVLRKN
ncbi:snaclec 1-like [Styela clava]